MIILEDCSHDMNQKKDSNLRLLSSDQHRRVGENEDRGSQDCTLPCAAQGELG